MVFLNNKRLLLGLIFLISLSASLSFLIFLGGVGPDQQDIPGNDYIRYYDPIARNILSGRGVTLFGELSALYAPGYPLLLAGVFSLADFLGVHELNLIVVFNILLAALSACFLFLIAETIFSTRVALIASGLWLSYPLGLWFLKNPNTEGPFMFLLYLGLWIYLRALAKKSFLLIFLAGIVFGSASLVRPIGFMLSFALALLVFYLVRERSKKFCFLMALLLLAGSLLAIFPWEAYVFSQTGKVIPLSLGGPGSVVDGLTFAVKPGAGNDRAIVSQDVYELMKRAQVRDPQSGGEVLNFVARELFSHPFALLKLLGWKLIRSWYATSQMWWEDKILLVQLFYLAPALAGLLYAFKRHKDKIRYLAFLLAIVLYFWLMTFLVLSMLRYMIPAMGLVLIFSAVALDFLWQKLSRS